MASPANFRFWRGTHYVKRYDNFYGGMSTKYPQNTIGDNQFGVLLNCEVQEKALTIRQAVQRQVGPPSKARLLHSHRDNQGRLFMLAWCEDGEVYFTQSPDGTTAWTQCLNGGVALGLNQNYLPWACSFGGAVYWVNGFNGGCKFTGTSAIDVPFSPDCSIIAAGPRRLIKIALTEDPSAIRFSALDNGDIFSGREGKSDHYQLTDESQLPFVEYYRFVIGAGDGDGIIGYYYYRKTHVFFKNRSVWIAYGGLDPTGTCLPDERFRYYPLTRTIGCLSGRCVAEDSNGNLLWRGYDGQMYSWNGAVDGPAGTEQYGITIKRETDPDDPRLASIGDLMDYNNGGFKKPNYGLYSVGADTYAEWNNANANNANIVIGPKPLGQIKLSKTVSTTEKDSNKPTGVYTKAWYMGYQYGYPTTTTVDKLAQSWIPSTNYVASGTGLSVFYSLNSDTQFYMDICADEQPSGWIHQPSATPLATSEPLTISAGTGGGGGSGVAWRFSFPVCPTLNSGTSYWMVLRCSRLLERRSGEFVSPYTKDSSYANGAYIIHQTPNPLNTWNDMFDGAGDAYFIVYGGSDTFNTGGVWFGTFDKGDDTSVWGLFQEDHFTDPAFGINMGTVSADGVADATHCSLNFRALCKSSAPTYGEVTAKIANGTALNTATYGGDVAANRYIGLVALLNPESLGGVVSARCTTAGTGYTVGDDITLTTGGTACTYNVDTITGGGGTGPIGTVTKLTDGSGYATGASATSGGTGSSAAFTIDEVSTRTHTPVLNLEKGSYVVGSAATALSQACIYRGDLYMTAMENTLLTPYNPSGTAATINNVILKREDYWAFSILRGFKHPTNNTWPTNQTDFGFNSLVNHDGVMYGALATAISGMISTVASAPTAGGTEYTDGDILTITTGGTGGRVTATVVDGIVTAVTKLSEGCGYTTGAGKATTGGTGSGCTVNITALNAYTYRLGKFDVDQAYDLVNDLNHKLWTWVRWKNDDYGMTHMAKKWHKTRTTTEGTSDGTRAGQAIQFSHSIDEGTYYPTGYDHGLLDSLTTGAIKTVSSTPVVGGTGYTIGDKLTVVQATGTAQIVVKSVNATTGAVESLSLYDAGTGPYTIGTKATTGGTGADCTVSITAVVTAGDLRLISPYLYTLGQVNSRWCSDSNTWPTDWLTAANTTPMYITDITYPNNVDVEYTGDTTSRNAMSVGYRNRPELLTTNKFRLHYFEEVWEPLSDGIADGTPGGISVETPNPS